MKLIADANILFSLIKKGSVTERLVANFGLRLYSVDFVLEELANHKTVLLKKSGLKTFSQVKNILEESVIFIEAKALESELKQVRELVSDDNDLIYFALAQKMNLVIWSNDKHFKEQDLFDVVTTKELIEILF